MCQHKAPHREWEPAPAAPGPRRRPQVSRAADPVRRLLRPRQGGARPGHDDREDADPAGPQADAPARLTPEQRKAWDAYYEPRNAAFREANLEGKDLVRWKYQRYMHDYLGCIKAVDESVGRLLKYLDDEGLAENTIVVYSSDQGFYLGEHGWFDKRWIFEESLRTPLLVRWPGSSKPGSVNVETRLEPRLRRDVPRRRRPAGPRRDAGPQPRAAPEGRDPADWRTSFYYHYYEYPGAAPRPPALRRRDRPLQARPLLRARRGLLGAVRPPGGPARAAERVRRPGQCAGRGGLEAEMDRLREELKVPATPPKEAYGGPDAPRRKPPAAEKAAG